MIRKGSLAVRHSKARVLALALAQVLALALVLLDEPDMLILDEPTNHLDMRTKDILKQALMEFDGTLILVSHDKAFLDAVCNRTIEISLGKITDQKMNYTRFLILGNGKHGVTPREEVNKASLHFALSCDKNSNIKLHLSVS